MKKDFTVIHMPEWVKKILYRKIARERYFLNRYGSLERMYEKDARFQEKLDNDAFEDEMEATKHLDK